ncbi:MAG: polymer-forming cytoskeletal protein [Candidatus Acidiferrales bacterium]
MWRKNEEAKPSSPGSKSSELAAAAPKQNPNAISSVSTPEPSALAATSSSAVPAAATPATESSKAAAAPITTSPSVAPASAAPAAPTSSSTIGAGLKIRGDVSGNSNLVIEGEVQGKVQMTNGRVTVAASGHVNADIEASEISIDGHVQGNLMATENVRLGATSHVQGSILTRRISIEDGASLRGKVEMIRASDAAAPSVGAAEAASKSTSPKAAAAGKQGN